MNTETKSLMPPEELNRISGLAAHLLDELDKILLGQHEVHRLLLIGVFSRGHVLLEGLPGVGKTALVKALGKLMLLEFKRIQFTPDLLPSDILGGSILQVMPDGKRVSGTYYSSPGKAGISGLHSRLPRGVRARLEGTTTREAVS